MKPNYQPVSMLEMSAKVAAHRARKEAAKRASESTPVDKTLAEKDVTIPKDPNSAPANQAALPSATNNGATNQAFKPAEVPSTEDGNAIEEANKDGMPAKIANFWDRAKQVQASFGKKASTTAQVDSAAQGGNPVDPEVVNTGAKIPKGKAAKPENQAALPSAENTPAVSADGDNAEKKARQLLSITPEFYKKIAMTGLGIEHGRRLIFEALEREGGAKIASQLINAAEQADRLESEIKQAATLQAVNDAAEAVKLAAVLDAQTDAVKQAAVKQASLDMQRFSAVEAQVKQAATEQACIDAAAALQAKQASYSPEQIKMATAVMQYHQEQLIKLASSAGSPEEAAAMEQAYGQGAEQAEEMAADPQAATEAAEQQPSLNDYVAMLQEAVASGQITEEEAISILEQAVAQLQQAGAAQQ